MTDNEIWRTYNERTKNAPPRPMLLKALALFGDFTGRAIDIGSGAGNDSLHLCSKGWEVLAVDQNPSGFELIREKLSPEQLNQFSSLEVSFEELQTLPHCDLVNANFSVPFCHPSCFSNVLRTILGAISENGRFAGNFFGKNDGWATNEQMTFCSIDEIKNYFSEFEIEFIEEKEFDGKNALGSDKHWDIKQIVAKKISNRII
jgi:Tellurite resistance protein TehB.